MRGWMNSTDLDLPNGMSLDVITDSALATQDRITTVAKNAYMGLFFVLIILALFLRFKVAIWGAAGIPIAIAGALSLFSSVGLTISSLTVMGFIIVLRIIETAELDIGIVPDNCYPFPVRYRGMG